MNDWLKLDLSEVKDAAADYEALKQKGEPIEDALWIVSNSSKKVQAAFWAAVYAIRYSKAGA